MSMQRRDPAAAVRRTTMRVLAADAVAGLIVFTFISHIVGVVLFLVGLIATGGYWYNFRQVLKTRGYR